MVVVIGFWIFPLIISLYVIAWFFWRQAGGGGGLGQALDVLFLVPIVLTLISFVWMLYFAALYFFG